DHVTEDFAAIEFVHRHRVRPRTDDAHAAFEHVEELRQLVDGRSAKEGAHARDSRVSARSGVERLLAVLYDAHRAELENQYLAAVEAIALLAEQHGPVRIEPDGDGCG